MAASRLSRWLLWAGVVLATLALVAVVGFHFATKALKSKVEEALGPHGEVGEIRVGLKSIEILGLRIKGADGWPAAEELSAKRVVITPDIAALLDKNVRISSISIEDAYLSMLRRKDGKLLILPSLLGAASQPGKTNGAENRGASAVPTIQIGGITLSNAAVDFFDASVRQPPVQLRMEQANANIGKLLLPDLSGRTTLELKAVVKGVRHDGTLELSGGMEIASKDSDLHARLQGVDLVAFQPYLIKAAETGVKKGKMNLDLTSTVKANRLHAPGKLTLADLELSSGKTFMGMPRDAVLSMMKDKNGQISVDFTLEGNINDPKFSLNENLAARIGSSVAGVLGISLEGLAKGLGSAGGSATKGIGDTIGKLFGK